MLCSAGSFSIFKCCISEWDPKESLCFDGIELFPFPESSENFQVIRQFFPKPALMPQIHQSFSAALIESYPWDGRRVRYVIYWDWEGISQLFCQPIPNCPFGGPICFLRCSWHSPFYTERLEKLFVYKELGSGRESACQEELGASSPVTPAGWGSLGKLQGNEVCLQSTCMHKKTCACAGGHV